MVATDAESATRLRFSSFDAFYANRWESIYRPLAVTLGNPDLAREAVDEGMARAFARWRHGQKVQNQEGWVYRVAYNWSISQLRKTGREVHGSRPIDAPNSTPLPNTDLEQALSRLSMEHRAIVVLRYLLDWSEADVCDALGIPSGTAKSRLNRALANLKKELT
jgi:RNA polymerase sigma-70 factor (ECF subfamily)